MRISPSLEQPGQRRSWLTSSSGPRRGCGKSRQSPRPEREALIVAARPRMYVTVGLPGAGKTTAARRIEAEKRALRLTPDDWMIPLYGHHNAGGKRDVLEGRFVWLALRALRSGVSVVLDFGVWARDERSALRWLAGRAGADCELVYVAVDEVERRRRVKARLESEPAATFPETLDDFDAHAGQFQVPGEDELFSSVIDDPPAGNDTWAAWAADRWPTSGLSD